MSKIGQQSEQPFRWFLGIVEDVKSDPLRLGRVKIRLINQNDFDEVNTEELLYASVMMPAHDASYQKVGRSPTGLEIGTRCIGFFLDGSRKQSPIIIGTTHHIPDRDESKHDVHDLAREKQTIDTKNNQEEGKYVKEPSSAYAAKYYDNKTITTSSGHVIEIDDTAGEERIHLYHKSGTYVEINKEGRTVLKNVGDYYEIDTKNKNVLINGNVTLEVKGNVKEFISGNVERTIRGNITEKIKGNKKVTIKGSYIIEIDGAITVVNVPPNTNFDE